MYEPSSWFLEMTSSMRGDRQVLTLYSQCGLLREYHCKFISPSIYPDLGSLHRVFAILSVATRGDSAKWGRIRFAWAVLNKKEHFSKDAPIYCCRSTDSTPYHPWLSTISNSHCLMTHVDCLTSKSTASMLWCNCSRTPSSRVHPDTGYFRTTIPPSIYWEFACFSECKWYT